MQLIEMTGQYSPKCSLFKGSNNNHNKATVIDVIEIEAITS